jgi:shikimate kinase
MESDRTSRNVRIYLMGMKHCGKSTLGRMLARRWDIRFLDLDDEIVNDHLSHENTHVESRQPDVRGIYRKLGKTGFQALESQAATRVASDARTSGSGLILALGGGTIENEDAMNAFPPEDLFAYLEEDADVLFARIRRGGLPPFLSGPDPYGEFLSLYDRRTALYRQKATITVPLAGKSIEAALMLLENMLQEYLDGRE